MANMYRCNKKGETGGAKLVGTYSSNTTIDVSAYGATSANQFILVPNSSASGSGSSSVQSQYSEWFYVDTSLNCSFSKGSLSLNNNRLTITLPTVSSSAQVVNRTRGNSLGAPSARATISCKLLYVGDIS